MASGAAYSSGSLGSTMTGSVRFIIANWTQVISSPWFQISVGVRQGMTKYSPSATTVSAPGSVIRGGSLDSIREMEWLAV